MIVGKIGKLIKSVTVNRTSANVESVFVMVFVVYTSICLRNITADASKSTHRRATPMSSKRGLFLDNNPMMMYLKQRHFLLSF